MTWNGETTFEKKYLVDKITCFETSSNYRSAEYNYDNCSKPNFGIDYLIVYDPLNGIETLYPMIFEITNKRIK